MSWRLRFAFATLVGPWVGIVIIGYDLSWAFLRHSSWLGEAKWTVDWFAMALRIAGPLLAAGAAIDAARLTRPGVVHQVTLGQRAPFAFVRIVAWTAAPAMAVHLIFISAGLIAGSVSKPSIGWFALAIGVATQLSMFVLYAAVGAAIGRFTSPLFAGLLAGGLVFATVVIASPAGGGPYTTFLDVSMASISVIGYTYNLPFHAVQIVVLLVAAVLLSIAPITIWKSRTAPNRKGLAALLAAVAIIVVPSKMMADIPRDVALEVEPTYCVQQDVEVCLFYEHRRTADIIIPALNELVSQADAAGYDAFVPHQLVQTATVLPQTGQRPGPKTFEFRPPPAIFEGKRPGPSELISAVLAPYHCPTLYGEEPPSDEYWNLFETLHSTWFQLTDDPDIETLRADQAALRATPAEVANMMDRLYRCDFGAGD